MEPIAVEFKGYTITTDKSLMQPSDVYQWLSEISYWTNCVPKDIFMRSFENSYCIGALINGRQVGFGRLITDYATFAYLADVYVEEPHRGIGLATKMMELLFNLDWVKNLRGIKLATKDAHELYRKFGFTEPKVPERLMEISRPGIYTDQQNSNT